MSSSDKIGVLTFHRCINYGSYWQARSLVEGLRSHGCDAVLLEHASSNVNRAEWQCALAPAFPTPTPKSDHALYVLKLAKFLNAFESLPHSRPFDLNTPEDMEDYDVVIVGSDEVWNLHHPLVDVPCSTAPASVGSALCRMQPALDPTMRPLVSRRCGQTDCGDSNRFQSGMRTHVQSSRVRSILTPNWFLIYVFSSFPNRGIMGRRVILRILRSMAIASTSGSLVKSRTLQGHAAICS